MEVHLGAETRTYFNIIGPIRDNGEVCGILGVNVDITERKRAEEALRLSEEHHRVLTETMLQGVVHHDADGTIIAMNPAAEHILGKTREQFLGSSSKGEEHDTIREDGSLFPGVEHPAMVALRTGQPVTGVVMGVFNPKVGDYRWISIDAVPLFRPGENRPYQVYAVFADITERKLAEAALRESEERFKLFMDNSPAIAWMKDEQGRYVYVNESSGRRIGVRPEDRIGKTDFELWPGETAELFRKNDQQVLASGQVVEVIEESIMPDGHRSYCRNFKFPFQDSTGRRFVGGVGIDITERRRAEEALEKAYNELEQRVKERTAELVKANDNLEIFRRFAEDSDQGFGMSDFDGRIVYANPTLCRMFGENEPEDVIGKNVSAYYPKEYVQRRKEELIPALLRGGHWHIEPTILPRHGRPIQTLQSTFLIRDADGSPLRIAVVISDITERKRAEEALHQSEERFRVAFEEAPLGIVMVVGEGILVRVNQTFCQMTGYTEEELIGKSVRDLTHPEDWEHSEELANAVLKGAIPSLRLEKRYLKKGGGVFWGQITVTAVHDQGGNVIFALGIIENITERKRAQEALAKEHRNLRHMLRSSDNERQLIAYEIHDGLAQQLAGAIMQFQAYGHLKDTQPKQAAKAYDAGLTMLQQGHFETRRLIAGVRPPILDEEGIVEAVAHLVHELGRDKGPKIENHSRVDFDRLDPTLENAIYRIAQEALTNACKHSKSERISVSLLQREDRLRIEIRDWGVGFDPKTFPKSHFGLEGIRQRARLLGGKCSIKSKAGKGTRIMVELPVVPRDEEE